MCAARGYQHSLYPGILPESNGVVLLNVERLLSSVHVCCICCFLGFPVWRHITTMSAPVPCSLATLHSHSIFAPSTPATGLDADWEVLDKPSDSEVGTKRTRLAVRDNDLFVAVGNEVRMVTLTGESWEVSNGRVGRYKVRYLTIDRKGKRKAQLTMADTRFSPAQLSYRGARAQPHKAATGGAWQDADRSADSSKARMGGRGGTRALQDHRH